MSDRTYPFIPTKVSEIKEGDFFYIPLSNGWFACGRVLLFKRKSDRKTKSILVGLHNWTGKDYPTKVNIHMCPIIEQGVMHINSISHVGGEIIGCKAPKEDGLKPLLQLEAGYLISGFDNLGSLPTRNYKKYSYRSTYGLNVIKLLAEKHFVKKS